jgi:hypothetical protein
MLAEEHELLKGSIFVLECKPPNNVPFRHLMYWSFTRTGGGEQEDVVSASAVVLVFAPSKNSKLVPHFTLGGTYDSCPTPHLKLKSQRGNVAQEVRPRRTKLRQLTLAHINH